jgi:hypothetical protein
MDKVTPIFKYKFRLIKIDPGFELITSIQKAGVLKEPRPEME